MTMLMPAAPPIRIGLMGLGGQSQSTHLPVVDAYPQAQLVAVCDTDPVAVATVTQQRPQVVGYRDYHRMLATEALDAVIVALPHQLHFDATLAAVRRRLHVLKEKPAALNAKQTAELAAAARLHNVHVLVGMQRRFNPIYGAARAYLAQIGKIFHIDGRYSIYTDEPHTGWRGSRALAGGGCLIDMGYHLLDLVVWYFGAPKKVFCEYSHAAIPNHPYDAEDTARVVFKTAEPSCWGSLLISRVMPPKQEYLHVLGTEGQLTVSKNELRWLTPAGGVREQKHSDAGVDSSVLQMQNFLQVIREGGNGINAIDQHMQHAHVVEACYQSASAGTYIAVGDPEVKRSPAAASHVSFPAIVAPPIEPAVSTGR